MPGHYRISRGCMVSIVGCETKEQEAALVTVARQTGELALMVTVSSHFLPREVVTRIPVFSCRGRYYRPCIGHLPVIVGEEGYWEAAGRFTESLG